MDKDFDDIFESINLMHKKYSSKEYIDSINNFSNNSKDLEQWLEKYNTDSSETKNTKKFGLFKKNEKSKKRGA